MKAAAIASLAIASVLADDVAEMQACVKKVSEGAVSTSANAAGCEKDIGHTFADILGMKLAAADYETAITKMGASENCKKWYSEEFQPHLAKISPPCSLGATKTDDLAKLNFEAYMDLQKAGIKNNGNGTTTAPDAPTSKPASTAAPKTTTTAPPAKSGASVLAMSAVAGLTAFIAAM